MLNCSCGDKCTIFLREDISAMEDAAQKFEQEEEISLELKKETEFGDDMFQQSSKYSCINDGFSPYCEVRFESKL